MQYNILVPTYVGMLYIIVINAMMISRLLLGGPLGEGHNTPYSTQRNDDLLIADFIERTKIQSRYDTVVDIRMRKLLLLKKQETLAVTYKNTYMILLFASSLVTSFSCFSYQCIQLRFDQQSSEFSLLMYGILSIPITYIFLYINYWYYNDFSLLSLGIIHCIEIPITMYLCNCKS